MFSHLYESFLTPKETFELGSLLRDVELIT